MQEVTVITTLERLALATLVVTGLLLPAAITRPQPASACHYDVEAGLEVLTGGLSEVVYNCNSDSPAESPTGTPSTSPPPSCAMSDVNVSATPDGNRTSYSYILECTVDNATFAFHATGVYRFDTRTAHEDVGGGFSFYVQADWTCPHDPWIFPSAVVCARTSPVPDDASHTYRPDFFEQTSPFSAEYLDDDLRQALFSAQLQYAVAHPSAPAPTPAPLQLAESSTVKLPTCTACTIAAPLQLAESSTVKLPTCTACTIASTTPNPPPAPSPQPAAYHDPSIGADGWPQLSTYTQGEAVRSVQYLLQQSAPTLPVDGKFGTDTEAAVRAFQKAQGLTVDGTVGKQTWQALIVTVQQGSQGAAVKAVQSQLKSRGVAITVDGYFGSQTDTAVKAYQKAHGLVVDGLVGSQTWQPLVVGT